ncbi:MAG: PIN domain-containing protein [Bacteroidota bacterium]
MKIIVDANIVFSAILNTNGKIADLLINSGKTFDFVAPNFLRYEIQKHYPRLTKISGLPRAKIIEAELHVCKYINFLSEEQIKAPHWAFAEKLVADVDPDDVVYIAYTKQFRCKLWSGDKALMKGLLQKGFSNFLTTDEMYNLRQSLI